MPELRLDPLYVHVYVDSACIPGRRGVRLECFGGATWFQFTPKTSPLFTPLLSCSVPQARCPDKGVQWVCIRALCSISTLTYGGQCWSAKTKYYPFPPLPPCTVQCVCVVGEVQGSWKHMTEHLRMDFNWLSVPELLKISLHTRTDTKLHTKWFQMWLAINGRRFIITFCNVTHFK